MKGLFDLPLELREMVYEFFLPENSIFNFTADSFMSDMRNIRNIGATNHRAKQEVAQFVSDRCGLFVEIRPDEEYHDRLVKRLRYYKKMMPLDHAKSLEFYINYDDDTISIDQYKAMSRPHRLVIDRLCKGLASVLRLFHGYEILPPLTIRFRDQPRPTTGIMACGDLFWTGTCPFCYRKGLPCTVLKRDGRKPMHHYPDFDEILAQFTWRPTPKRRRYRESMFYEKFRSVHIVPLRGLTSEPLVTGWIDHSEGDQPTYKPNGPRWHNEGIVYMWTEIKWAERVLKAPES